MSPAPRVAAVDDSAAGPASATLGGIIDESGLAAEVTSRNPNYNPQRPHPFRRYIEAVIQQSGVPLAKETREMASVICSEVAALPFLPDSEENIGENGETEYDLQVIKTAKRAEENLDSAMVWTASARKLSSAALALRKKDPDGSKGIAWVNDPLPGEVAPILAPMVTEDAEVA
jgi:hypothetical protein